MAEDLSGYANGVAVFAALNLAQGAPYSAGSRARGLWRIGTESGKPAGRRFAKDGHSPTDCRTGPGDATCGGFKGCNTVGITGHTGM